MQPPNIFAEKYIGFIGKIVVFRLDTEQKNISGRVEEIDYQTGLITLTHKDGRHSIVQARSVAFMSEVKA